MVWGVKIWGQVLILEFYKKYGRSLRKTNSVILLLNRRLKGESQFYP